MPAPYHHIVPPLASRGQLAFTLAELEEWGERFGRAVRAPLVIALSGELGAGKTTLARSICRGFGVTEEVTSPTFALVHEYAAPRFPVLHVDLFRLEGPSQLENIGWDEIVSAHALVLIEWAERAAHMLPPSSVRIDLEHLAGDPDRRLVLAG
ncbi:MAG: tRNA (adenosine(37)-N6)-threonylcarbamoyltransferase complex ATPase subunit type 1 TsaE [Gemmatimonadaceae bacterium]